MHTFSNMNDYPKYPSAPDYPPQNVPDYPPQNVPEPSPRHEGYATAGIPMNPVPQIYNTAPPAAIQQGRDWNTNLSHCFDDLSSFCVTAWCPCITFGQIAEIIDKGETPCFTSGLRYGLLLVLTAGTGSPLYSCFYRSKLRRQFDLKEDPCNDCLVHCFCEFCALCQEYRELKSQGFDLSIGWQGSVERLKRSHPTTMTPPNIPGTMLRYG